MEMFKGDHKCIYVKENNVFVCLDGAPTALKRHRSCISRNRIRTYDSQKELKQRCLKQVLMQIPKGFKPFDVPVEFLVEFHMPIPASFSARKRKMMIGTPHAKKPDSSNLIKFFEDIFTGVLYTDDRLIVKIKETKINYETPRTIICVREYVPEESFLDEIEKGLLVKNA